MIVLIKYMSLIVTLVFEGEWSVGGALKLNYSRLLHNGLLKGFSALLSVSLPTCMCVTVVVHLKAMLAEKIYAGLHNILHLSYLCLSFIRWNSINMLLLMFQYRRTIYLTLPSLYIYHDFDKMKYFTLLHYHFLTFQFNQNDYQSP